MSLKTTLARLFAVLGLVVGFNTTAQAEIIKAEPDHVVLKLEARSALSPDDVWARLIEPAQWWSSDHTYSGDAANLSLDAQAGGLWREDWENGSVWHGAVMQVQTGQVIRFNAPFGPLQGLAVEAIWTITLTPGEDGGTLITFDHITNGTSASGLDKIAPAVHFVKSEALKNLARPLED